MSSSDKPLPLQGVKVIEIGTLIAGPYAASLLAQFGAEVIKIESPVDGDPLRKWRKLHKGTSLWWYSQSRNKKSVTVNLKAEKGAADRPRPGEGRGHRDRELPARAPSRDGGSAGRTCPGSIRS